MCVCENVRSVASVGHCLHCFVAWAPVVVAVCDVSAVFCDVGMI